MQRVPCRAPKGDHVQPIRIWYQSYVDEEHAGPYWDRLRDHLAALVDPGTQVDVKGITPHDSYAHALVEMRCAREVICNAVRAEREGYDALSSRVGDFIKRPPEIIEEFLSHPKGL